MTDFETTAAEVSRNFGRFQDAAQQAPVHVTHHGRPRVVILSAEAFDRLRRQAAGRAPAVDPAGAEAAGAGTAGLAAAGAGGDGEAALEAVLTGLGQGFVALDTALRVTEANPTIQAWLGRREASLLGLPLPLPASRAGLIEERLRWVLRSGEAAAFELRGVPGEAAVLAVRAFPYRGGLGLVLENASELATLRAERTRWQAEHALLAGHPAICVAELDGLGFVLDANPAMRRFLGLAEPPAQSGLRLTDVAAPLGRQALSEGMSRLLQFQTESVEAQVEFLTRESGRRALALTLRRRMRGETCEGFVAVGLEAG